MAITVGIVGQTGQGKTTSIIINPDGKCFFLPEDSPGKAEQYEGLEPASTVIIECDKKTLPFPCKQDWVKNKNVFFTSDMDSIMKLLGKLTREQTSNVLLLTR